jgi:O-antigen ligase
MRVDARIDLPSSLRRAVERRRTADRSIDRDFHVGLSRVLATDRAATWEWGVAIAALFVLGRSNVLFIRQRLSALIGTRAGPMWQDDIVLQLTFAIVQAVVLVIAIRRARPSALLRQPVLLAFVAMAWLSVMWSVEPDVSVRRVLLFAGTVAVGWFVGDRFAPKDQIRIVIAVSALAVVGTLIGLTFWNELATSTNGVSDQWSGIYVNRNLLAAVLSGGLLAIFFLPKNRARRWPMRALGVVLFFLLAGTQSRTGTIAIMCAGGVAFAVWLLRRYTADRLSATRGAYITFASLATVGLAVNWYWVEILSWFGRDPSLTKRTWIWEVDRWLVDRHPWTGWGFEAIWTHPRAVEQSFDATGRYPYSAHSGYFDLMLSLGRIGVVLFVAFLVVAAWRAFIYAWRRADVTSLWPLTFIVFAAVMNFSESLFVSSEALTALTIACAVAVTEWPKRQPTEPSEPAPAVRGPG